MPYYGNGKKQLFAYVLQNFLNFKGDVNIRTY